MDGCASMIVQQMAGVMIEYELGTACCHLKKASAGFVFGMWERVLWVHCAHPQYSSCRELRARQASHTCLSVLHQRTNLYCCSTYIPMCLMLPLSPSRPLSTCCCLPPPRKCRPDPSHKYANIISPIQYILEN